mmetsp:Transcript_44190/g.140454  ORF Transcript_44190/g.140454 Transcript_44190/m.140454 type:complete len:288 (-) Transcript_44190:750-1613(-)
MRHPLGPAADGDAEHELLPAHQGQGDHSASHPEPGGPQLLRAPSGLCPVAAPRCLARSARKGGLAEAEAQRRGLHDDENLHPRREQDLHPSPCEGVVPSRKQARRTDHSTARAKCGIRELDPENESDAEEKMLILILQSKRSAANGRTAPVLNMSVLLRCSSDIQRSPPSHENPPAVVARSKQDLRQEVETDPTSAALCMEPRSPSEHDHTHQKRVRSGSVPLGVLLDESRHPPHDAILALRRAKLNRCVVPPLHNLSPKVGDLTVEQHAQVRADFVPRGLEVGHQN